MKSKIQHCANLLSVLLSKIGWLPPLLARIVIGVVFVESGWGKLHNIEKVIEFFTSLEIPFPELQAPFVAGVEFAAGLMLIFGLAARAASVPLIGIMAVAIITAKAPEISSFSDIFGFSEFLYIVLLVWILVSGPGTISSDQAILKIKKEKT